MSSLRHAFRSLLRQPGFSFVAVLTLALGIGATTAIFTVVDAVLLQPLPYPDHNRIVVLQERLPQYPNPISLSVLNYPDMRDQTTSFERVGVVRNVTMNLTGTDEPVRISAKMISADILDTLQVQPMLGRGFLPAEDAAGAEPVAIVSFALWQNRLGAANDIVGSTLQLDGRAVTVVGVMPASFRIFAPSDVYLPVWPWLASQPQDRTWHPGLIGMARLKPDVSMEQASTELAQFSARLEAEYPEANRGIVFMATPAQEVMVQGVRPALLMIVGAVGGVLLIACINVAGLLLARGLAKKREMAVRTALGAGRAALVKLALWESLVLAVAGAAAGLLLASALVPALVRLVGTSLPRAENVAIDTRVLLFTLGLSVVSALVFGLLPALSSARVDIRDALSEGGRGSAGGHRQRRTRRLLVTAEIALTMTLLVSAGLLMRSFVRLQDVSPGFSPSHLMVAEVPLSPRTYAEHGVRTNAVQSLLERVSVLPGVQNAAVTTLLPLSGTGGSLHFNIEGRQPRSSAEWITLHLRAASQTYFSTMQIPIRWGRGFTPVDREGAPHIAVVTEAFVRQYFPNEEPLGKRIAFGTVNDGSQPWREIVGVVGDLLQTPDGDGRAELFVPYEQHPDDFFTRLYQNITVVVRTAGDPNALAPDFRQVVRAVDPNQPIVNLRTMDAVMSASVAQPRLRTTLLGLFAVIALVLAGIGVYGLLAHGVAQRRGEFGLRLALGASPGQVTSLVMREGLVLVAIGLALGVAGAIFAVRIVQTMLFGVTMWDAAAWSAAALALALVAALASWVPARRATKVPPATALRA